MNLLPGFHFSDSAEKGSKGEFLVSMPTFFEILNNSDNFIEDTSLEYVILKLKPEYEDQEGEMETLLWNLKIYMGDGNV